MLPFLPTSHLESGVTSNLLAKPRTLRERFEAYSREYQEPTPEKLGSGSMTGEAYVGRILGVAGRGSTVGFHVVYKGLLW